MCVCRCASVGHTGEPYKTAEPTSMPCSGKTRVGPYSVEPSIPGEYDGSICVTCDDGVASYRDHYCALSNTHG